MRGPSSRSDGATGIPPGDRSVREWVRGLVDDFGAPDAVKRVEDIFSREVLGSVLVAAATEQVVEVLVGLSRGVADVSLLGIWAGVWLVTVALFVSWDYVAEGTTETADTVVEETVIVADETAEEVIRETEVVAREADDVAQEIEEFVDVVDVFDEPPAEDSS